jgi:outer membrane receptor for ferrienterochelin and colicins
MANCPEKFCGKQFIFFIALSVFSFYTQLYDFKRCFCKIIRSIIYAPMIRIFILLTVIMCKSMVIFTQKGTVFGSVYIHDKPAEFVTIQIKGSNIGTITDENGAYVINNLPFGIHTLIADMVGMDAKEQEINLSTSQPNIKLDFELEEVAITIHEIVVTGTKTFKRKSETATIVNILDSKTLNNLQVCNLSEGLKFQPGLRVETDCQTCGYTQLRMNGLAGGYSQILINGRPIFSPLMSLYGMEQLPVNMIDRIEVVRGGGSSLYGSSAIAGTVNVITKIPKKNYYEISSTYQNTDGSRDMMLNANTTWVNDAKNAGISFFMNHRDRSYYDANDDNFSELPTLKSTSIGANFFVKPDENQKIELSLSKLDEYRYGGEMIDKPAYLTQQSEERKHDIWLGSMDYQINFNQDNSSLITYAAFQNTLRTHYTGIFPDDADDILKHIENPPYGTSKNITIQGGIQVNHRLNKFLGGKNVLTFGSEYISDDILDKIPSYKYLIDQTSMDWGTFAQSDWEVLPSLNLLSGLRADKHNLIDGLLLSPRASMLYKLKGTTQFRLGYGTGFRAPQAFDTDLHIAFAGGGVSRIQLDKNLRQERSKSWSASVNFDKANEKYIAGFTAEVFYTQLKDAFVLENTGQDGFGEIFTKKNGSAAVVQGVTLEGRLNYNKVVQIESGLTLQSSRFDSAVKYIDEAEPLKQFLRTPKNYGFININLNPDKKWAVNMNYIYTGSMKLVHFGGAENFFDNVITSSKPFSELSVRTAYTLHLHNKFGSDVEIYGGVKNIFNAYQSDFDKGKNRDSNYVYGPGLPRTFFIGFKIKAE